MIPWWGNWLICLLSSNRRTCILSQWNQASVDLALVLNWLHPAILSTVLCQHVSTKYVSSIRTPNTSESPISNSSLMWSSHGKCDILTSCTHFDHIHSKGWNFSTRSSRYLKCLSHSLHHHRCNICWCRRICTWSTTHTSIIRVCDWFQEINRKSDRVDRKCYKTLAFLHRWPFHKLHMICSSSTSNLISTSPRFHLKAATSRMYGSSRRRACKSQNLPSYRKLHTDSTSPQKWVLDHRKSTL